MCLSQLDIQYADGDDNVVGGDGGSDVVVVVVAAAFAATSIDGVGAVVNDDDDDDDLSTAAKKSLSYLSFIQMSTAVDIYHVWGVFEMFCQTMNMFRHVSHACH